MVRSTHSRAHKSLPVVAVLCALICSLIFTTGCSTTSIGEHETGTQVNQIVPSRLAIVHTGSIEGAFAREDGSMGIAAVTQVVKDLEEEGYEVLLLDSGDSFTGNKLVNLSDGETPVAFMNAAGYDAIAVNERELSLGAALLKKRISQSDFTYLSANVKPASDETTKIQESMIFTMADGRSIGIFGLTDPNAYEDFSLLAADDFDESDDELVDIAHEQVAALRAEGCRLVVCLANLGVNDEGVPRALNLAEHVSGINVMLDVNDTVGKFTATDASGDYMLVVETAKDLTGASIVTWEQGKISVRFTNAEESKDSDEQVEALVSQSQLELDQRLSEVVATAARTPSLASGGAASGLGQLVTDAVLWEADRSSKEKPVAALFTTNLLQKPLPSGDITNEDVLETLSHAGTKLCTIEVKGSQLQAVLAPLLAAQPVYDNNTPYCAGIELKRETGEDNVPRDATIAKVGGKDFSPTETYVIATCEPLIEEGGALSALLEDTVKPVAVGTSATKALMGFLGRECKGVVPDAYLEAPAPEPAPEAVEEPAPEP